MEKSEKQLCDLLPHPCSKGLSEPKTVSNPEPKTQEETVSVPGKQIRKPWSIFGDIYFL